VHHTRILQYLQLTEGYMQFRHLLKVICLTKARTGVVHWAKHITQPQHWRLQLSALRLKVKVKAVLC